jgi:hypothetical protein
MKGYVMSKRIISWILSTALILSSSVYAENIAPENNICRSKNTVVAFFNGVRTTNQEARDDLKQLESINGKVAPNGDPIEYSVMYNYTNGLEDFAETFEQRFKEEVLLKDRWELFFQMLDDKGSWWDNIVQKVPELIKDGNDWRKLLVSNFAKNLSKLLSSPLTEQNYQEHRAKIDNWVIEGKKLLFIAHSQGNLFANEAYRYTTQKISSDSVKVIHIAPASPTTNGPHILADQDFVINALRVLGTVPSITHLIPPYKFGGNNAGRDIIGHSLIQTYLNPAFSMYSTIKDDITQALNSLQAPPKKGSSGFFTATLTWDGSGDVDLHAIEPTGYHVSYERRIGTSGYLDIDNTQGYGPEHYVASCDKTKLATGIYQISLANYTGADGRHATVQISSDANGVLATRTGTVGSETRGTPSLNMFNVRVSFDNKTNKYSASIE